MLADRLTAKNFSPLDEHASGLQVKTLPGWLYYHFGGRTEEEMEVLFAHAMSVFAFVEEEGVSYLEMFSRLNSDQLFACWQEVVRHA